MTCHHCKDFGMELPGCKFCHKIEKPKSKPLEETIKELEAQGHKDALDRERLKLIASHLQRWIDYDLEKRTKEGIATTDDTHIMAPPTWPSHGQLKHWIKVLREAAGVV